MSALRPEAVIEQGLGRWWDGWEKRRTPTSDRCLETLKPVLEEFAPSEEAMVQAFDAFEFLMSMDYSHRVWPEQEVDPNSGRVWAPTGTFAWRGRWGSHRRDGGAFTAVADRVLTDIEAQGDRWGPLRAGFFNGQAKRAVIAARNVDKIVEANPSLYW